jgi:hypothetical protein
VKYSFADPLRTIIFIGPNDNATFEMTKQELQGIIQSWENMPLVITHSWEHPETMDLLLSIAFDDSQAINWRAMYLFELIHNQYPELVVPYLPAMSDFLFTTKNASKKRHLLKLISLHDLPEENMAFLLNFCIEEFTNATQPVAVRVHAMQILFNIAQKEPEFANELIDLIENEIEYHGSAGISSRGLKLLKKLKSQPKT